MLEMLDGFDLAEVYTTHLGTLEDAGDGMMRVIRCVKRRNVLVPVVSIILPAIGVLQDGPRFREAAQEIVRGNMAAH